MKNVLLITGASSDLGRSFLQKYIDRYDYAWLHCNNSSDLLLPFCDKYKDKVQVVRADFSNYDDTARMAESIVSGDKCPSHILHISAPRPRNKNFHKTDWMEYQNYIDISVRSAEIILRTVLPHMSKHNYGRIAFVLSSCTLPGKIVKYLTPYIVSKYALYGMLQCVAKEYADRGITINAISPEMMETGFLESIPNIVIEENARRSPLGRNLRIDEVVTLISFLLSDESGAITGENIGITGGM